MLSVVGRAAARPPVLVLRYAYTVTGRSAFAQSAARLYATASKAASAKPEEKKKPAPKKTEGTKQAAGTRTAVGTKKPSATKPAAQASSRKAATPAKKTTGTKPSAAATKNTSVTRKQPARTIKVAKKAITATTKARQDALRAARELKAQAARALAKEKALAKKQRDQQALLARKEKQKQAKERADKQKKLRESKAKAEAKEKELKAKARQKEIQQRQKERLAAQKAKAAAMSKLRKAKEEEKRKNASPRVLAAKYMENSLVDVEPPRPRHGSALTAFFSEKKGNIADVVAAYKQLTPAEKELYLSKAREMSENKNQVYIKWLGNYTGAQIVAANTARKAIRRLYRQKGVSIPSRFNAIKDPRDTSKKVSAYSLFLSDYFKSQHTPGTPTIETLKAAQHKFKALPENELKALKQRADEVAAQANKEREHYLTSSGI